MINICFYFITAAAVSSTQSQDLTVQCKDASMSSAVSAQPRLKCELTDTGKECSYFYFIKRLTSFTSTRSQDRTKFLLVVFTTLVINLAFPPKADDSEVNITYCKYPASLAKVQRCTPKQWIDLGHRRALNLCTFHCERRTPVAPGTTSNTLPVSQTNSGCGGFAVDLIFLPYYL